MGDSGAIPDTELPAAISQAVNALAYPTAPLVGAVLLSDNGASLDKIANPSGLAEPGSSRFSLCVTPMLWDGANGIFKERAAVIFKTLSAVTITSETTLWTPAAGKKFRLLGGVVSMGTAAGNVTLKDNTGGTTILIIPKAPLDTPVLLNLGKLGKVSAAANNVLTATGASTETISGTIWGTEE